MDLVIESTSFKASFRYSLSARMPIRGSPHVGLEPPLEFGSFRPREELAGQPDNPNLTVYCCCLNRSWCSALTLCVAKESQWCHAPADRTSETDLGEVVSDKLGLRSS